MLWNKDGNENMIRNMAVGITELTKRDSKVLRAIRNELIGNCKHPKKLRQIDSEGNLYCMGCNQDL